MRSFSFNDHIETTDSILVHVEADIDMGDAEPDVGWSGDIEVSALWVDGKKRNPADEVEIVDAVVARVSRMDWDMDSDWEGDA